MDKAHDVHSISFQGTMMLLRVDGEQYRVDIAAQSERLAVATQEQRESFEISPAGYGIHWPEVDEDLSVDGLIGLRHTRLHAETAA